MFADIIAAIIGFYMATVVALFGGADAPVASSTDARAHSTGTPTNTLPAGARPDAKTYTQGKYYAEGTYLPSISSDKLVATAISGSTRAPLTVEFSGEVSSTGYSIEFGDGQMLQAAKR